MTHPTQLQLPFADDALVAPRRPRRRRARASRPAVVTAEQLRLPFPETSAPAAAPPVRAHRRDLMVAVLGALVGLVIRTSFNHWMRSIR